MKQAGSSPPSTAEQPIRPIPFWQMTMVVLLQVAECVNINVLFPFIAFMVEDFGYSGQQLGIHTGMLAGAFCGAQFCSSFLWGSIADRVGRKPTILFGTIGAALGMAIFGSATTYKQALVGRIVSGFLNGNLGVVKTFLTEITDDTNRSYGFSLISLAWSVGTVIAPVIGGLLCNPADKYPKVFDKHGILGQYPYLFPCLLCVLNSIICAIICALAMEETLVIKRPGNNDSDIKNIKYEAVNIDESAHGGNLATTQSCLHKDDGNDYNDDDKLEGGDMNVDGDIDDYGDIELTSKESRLIQKLSMIIERPHEDPSNSSLSGDSSDSTSDDKSSEDKFNDNEDDEICCPSILPGSKNHVLRQKLIVLATSNYALLAMAYVLLDETLPLFLKLETSKGGFSFGSADIGALISIAGVGMCFFNFFVLPYFTAKSKIWLFKIGVILSIPSMLLWPVIANLNHNYLSSLSDNTHFYIKWFLMITIMMAKNILATFSFTSVMIQVNHSALAEDLGKANGLGQSLASLARSIGPAIGGVLWSLTIKYDFIYLNFIGFGLVSALCLIINGMLPASIELRKVPKK